MKRLTSARLITACMFVIALLVLVSSARAEMITFDGSGYVAAATPPAPWTDYYTWSGSPKGDLVYQVVAGAGVGGSQALAVYNNGYFEGAAVYLLPVPLTSGGGAKRITMLLDPPQNDPYGLNFISFGGVAMGRGWLQPDTAVYRGVYFEKEDWEMHGGDDPTDYIILGPGGVFGYFEASAAQNYYRITFDINAAFDSIVITVTYPGGSTVTQTTAWDGGAIDKVWLWDANDNYTFQPVYYDNLYVSDNSSKNDFNADRKTDILLRNTTSGKNLVWFMDNVTRLSYEYLTDATDPAWTIVGTGDFNADGKTDILWRKTTTGQNLVWYMDGTTRSSYEYLLTVADTTWTIAGTCDFNADGKTDILWRNTSTGRIQVWYMDGVTRTSYVYLPRVADLSWIITGTGDFNNDGMPDILWRNTTTGRNMVWYMNGVTKTSSAYLTTNTDQAWKTVGTGDFNADGKTDLLWRNTTTGQNMVWYMDGVTRTSYAYPPSVADQAWTIVGK
ncbi:MAG: VCBS repeat-containing protein [Deltaproteobacteria bacterium]